MPSLKLSQSTYTTAPNTSKPLNQSYYLNNGGDSNSQLVSYSAQQNNYANMQIVPYVRPADNQITLRDSSLLRLYPEIKNINSSLNKIQNLQARDLNIHKPSESYIALERDFCNFSKMLADKLMGNGESAGDINDSIKKREYNKAEKLIYILYELKTVYMPRIPFMQAFMINKNPFLNDLAIRFRTVVYSLKANAGIRNENTPLNAKVKLEAGVSNGADALAKACHSVAKTQDFINMFGSSSFAMPVILTINLIGKASFMVLLNKDEKLLGYVRATYGDCDNMEDVIQSIERFICFAYNNIMIASLCSSQLDRINQLRKGTINANQNIDIDINKLIKDTNTGITLFDKKGASTTTNLKHSISRMSSLNAEKREKKKLEQKFDLLKTSLSVCVDNLFKIIGELNNDKSSKHLSIYKTDAEKLTKDTLKELIKLMSENASGILSTLDTRFTPNIEYIPISYGESKTPPEYNPIVNARN